MIDRETVERVAHLARIALDEERVPELVRELGGILDHVERLDALDLVDVPPLTHASGGHDVYRDDAPAPSLSPDDALANAPDRQDAFYRVPRVIEEA